MPPRLLADDSLTVLTPLGVDLSPRSAYRPVVSANRGTIPAAMSPTSMTTVTPTPQRKRPRLLSRLSPFHRRDDDNHTPPSLTAASSLPTVHPANGEFASRLRQPNPRLPDLYISDPLIHAAKDRQWPIDEARPLCHPPTATGVAATARVAVAKSRIVTQRSPTVSSLTPSTVVPHAHAAARRPSTAPTISDMHPFVVTPRARLERPSSVARDAQTQQNVPKITFDNPSPFTSIASARAAPPFGYNSRGPASSSGSQRSVSAYTGPRSPPRPARSSLRPAPLPTLASSTPHSSAHMPMPTFHSPTFGGTPTPTRLTSTRLQPTPSTRPSPHLPIDDEEMGFMTMIRKDSQEVAEQIRRELAGESTAAMVDDETDIGSKVPIDGLPNSRRESLSFGPTVSTSEMFSPVARASSPLDGLRQPNAAACSEESLVRMHDLHHLINSHLATQPMTITHGALPVTPQRPSLYATSRMPVARHSDARYAHCSTKPLADDTQYASIRSWLCTIRIHLQLLDISKGQLYQHNSALIDTCDLITECLQHGGASPALTFTIMSDLADSLDAWWREEARSLNAMREAAFAQYDVYLAQHDVLLRQAYDAGNAGDVYGVEADGDVAGRYGTITVSSFAQSKQRIDGRESLLQARLDESDLQRRIRRWARDQVMPPPVCVGSASAVLDGRSSSMNSSIMPKQEPCAKMLSLVKALEHRGELQRRTATAIKHEMRKAGWITEAIPRVSGHGWRPSTSHNIALSSSDSGSPRRRPPSSSSAMRYEPLRDAPNPADPALTSSRSQGRKILNKVSRIFRRPSSRGIHHFQAFTPSDPLTDIDQPSPTQVRSRPKTSRLGIGRAPTSRSHALGRLRGAVQSTIELVSGSSNSLSDQPERRREPQVDEYGIPTADAVRARRYREEKIASGMQRRASLGASSVLDGLFGRRTRADIHPDSAPRHHTASLGTELRGDVREWAAAVETPTPRQNMFRTGSLGLEVEVEEEVLAWSGTARRLSDLFDEDPRTLTRTRDRASLASAMSRVSAMYLCPPSAPAYDSTGHLDPRQAQHDVRPRRDTPPSDRSHNVLTPAHHSPPSPKCMEGTEKRDEGYVYIGAGYPGAFDGGQRDRGVDDDAVPPAPSDGLNSVRAGVKSGAIVQRKALQGYSAQFSFVAQYTPDREDDEKHSEMTVGGSGTRAGSSTPGAPDVGPATRPATSRASSSAPPDPFAMETPRSQCILPPAAQRPRVLVRDERRTWVPPRASLPTQWQASRSDDAATRLVADALNTSRAVISDASTALPAKPTATRDAAAAVTVSDRGTGATVGISSTAITKANASTFMHTHRTGRTEDWEKEENSPERYRTRMLTQRAARLREGTGSAVFVELSGRPRTGTIG